ncbi:DotD/TraH family lipoprotein (plasmid) [Serratia symbiotica]|uniref:DotD/TraH family lipoprotein n=2 Tax=Serratia symbiotica TaxID=138074 RepID=A0A068Z4C6_9GAMM|nr:DotD/TraH family lipoprotein [Serratia symbiotica]CDS57037.1 Conjugal transfer protein [Serratia symbiotica]
MKMSILAPCMAALLLTGCQTASLNHRASSSVAASSRVASGQQLRLEGDMFADTPRPVAVIRADSDRVTLAWHGDAVELLGHLAHVRGQIFSFVGVRLPLPVDIQVQGVTYANLLRIIEMQTAWRATLAQYPGQLVLQFMTAIPERQGGGR